MEGPIVKCAACGQVNRLPAVGSGQKAVCGKCKAPLSAGGAPIVLTDANFASTIASGKFVVDFWAGWCGPCVMISPIINALASERTDVRFGKLNVDENPRTASSFNVQGIPLLVFMRDGKETGRVTGAVPKARIEAAITQYLGA
jgi:thioredoxin 2